MGTLTQVLSGECPAALLNQVTGTTRDGTDKHKDDAHDGDVDDEGDGDEDDCDEGDDDEDDC